MFKTLTKKISDWNRRRNVARLRRSFANVGYPVDHLDDSKVEAAVRTNQGYAAPAPLTARSIYFALRRLAKDQDRVPYAGASARQ